MCIDSIQQRTSTIERLTTVLQTPSDIITFGTNSTGTSVSVMKQTNSVTNSSSLSPSTTTTSSTSAFKQAQLRYRRCHPNDNDPSAWNEIIDLLKVNSSHSSHDRIEKLQRHNGNDSSTNNIYNGPMYRIVDYPGCIILPNALSKQVQYQLAHAALTEYCVAPHQTNLHNSHTTTTDNLSLMWDEWKARRICRNKTNNHTTVDSTVTTCNNTKRSTPIPTPTTSELLGKLSWSTMGYHYDWTNRLYIPPCCPLQSMIPNELIRLSNTFYHTILNYYKQLRHSDRNNDNNNNYIDNNSQSDNTDIYNVTACIVNYYNTKSIMGGHRDDLEVALHQPVISISIGCPAIFLFGGTSLDDIPVIPVLVRSGDVIMFGGPNRLNYHSMVRIIPSNVLPDAFIYHYPDDPISNQYQIEIDQIFSDDDDDDGNMYNNTKRLMNDETEMFAINEYLSNHRININLRQVY
jgi:alkylated DNA repair dioxygenase AlkB